MNLRASSALVLSCVLLFPLFPGWASPLPSLTSSPSGSPLQPPSLRIPRFAQRGARKVKMRIKLVYAYTQDKPSVDRELQHDLPSLQRMYDFNVYRLLRTFAHSIQYKQALIIPINSKYQIQLSPQTFDKKSKKIAIRATFLKKKRLRNSPRPQFSAYASASIRLQNGGKVAFIGPAYGYGRVLLILTANQR